MNNANVRPDHEGLTPYNFSCCNTHGGKAFRDWAMLLKHKGVFIGFRNYDWVIYISSDPQAKWVRGCQDSCAHGDPLPQSPDGARLIDFSELPEEARDLCKQWIEEAIKIAKAKIEEKEREEYERQLEKLLERREKKRREIDDPWIEAVKKARSKEAI